MPSAASNPTYKLLPSLWSKDKIYEALLEASPTLGIIPKDTNMVETKRYVPVGYGSPQGLGTSYGGAKFAKSASTAIEWEIQHKHYYGLFSIDGFLWRQSEYGKRTAVLIDPMTRDSSNLMEQAKRDISRAIFGNGGGAIGQASAVSTNRITFASARDIRGIENNMLLEASTADGTSGSVKAGYVSVSQVGDEENPFVDVSEATVATGIPTVAGTDYFFRRDTFGAMISGFKSWLPAWSTGSLPGTFKGVNRNVNAPRLAGRYVDVRTLSPRAALLRACVRSADGNGKPSHYICSTSRWEALANELSAAGALTMTKAPAADIGGFKTGVEYEAIKFTGPKGPVTVIADPECGDADSWLIQADTWVLGSLGDLLHWEFKGRQEDGADAKECMLVGDMEMYCRNPYPNVRLRHA